MSTELEIIEAMAFKARQPTMLVGSPGTGKTALIRDLADTKDYHLSILLGSQISPLDLKGVMKSEIVGKTSKGKDIFAAVSLSPDWQAFILKRKRVVLFLDEYSNVQPSTRAGFLTLIQDRVFPNGQMLPDETVVIGAMNPVEESADGNILDRPTSNRFFFMAWDPPAAQWYEGMLNAWGKEVSEQEMEWRKKIVEFVRKNPGLLHRLPRPDDHNQFVKGASEQTVFESAWPSRRSWDNLAKALAHIPSSVTAQDIVANGLVGISAATNFRDWLRKTSSIDPEKVLDDPDSVDWSTLSIDDYNLVLRSILDLLNAETAISVIQIFEKVADSNNAHLGGPFIGELSKRLGKVRGKNVAEIRKSAMPMIAKYRSIGKNV